MICIMLKELPF